MVLIGFIPFSTESKQGLSTRVSLKQALADQGITGEGRSLTERDLWVQKEKEALAAWYRMGAERRTQGASERSEI